MTFGATSGVILGDLILGRTNPVAEVLAASRIRPLSAAGRMTTGVLSMMQHYGGDRFGNDSEEAIAKIPDGEGHVLRVNGEHMALCRDGNDQWFAYSAVCNHMGCIVHWNSAEKSWDCPCHGGRYDTFGRVIAGPPVEALAERNLMNE